MKKLLTVSIFVLATAMGKAQLSPVTWSFSASKTGDKMYEVKMVATLENKWHLYSQNQPDDAVIMPTSFKFNPNPLFSLQGKVKETGKLEKFIDKELGLSANQYSNIVIFTQKIKLKANVKTNLTGSVEYQTCDDKKCLPPKTVPYTIVIK